MKIVYMGTPEIAKVCLEKFYTEGFDIAAVYTKQDTPKNRGMKLIASEVKAYAQSVGLPVYQPAGAGYSEVRLHQHACEHFAVSSGRGASAVVDPQSLRRDGRDGDVFVFRNGRGRYH